MFVNKQPVLDENNEIKAYVMDYASYRKRDIADYFLLFMQNLFHIGLHNIVQDKPAIVRIHQSSLMKPEVDAYASQSIVLALDEIAILELIGESQTAQCVRGCNYSIINTNIIIVFAELEIQESAEVAQQGAGDRGAAVGDAQNAVVMH